jgi:hypothetical protein
MDPERSKSKKELIFREDTLSAYQLDYYMALAIFFAIFLLREMKFTGHKWVVPSLALLLFFWIEPTPHLLCKSFRPTFPSI